MNTPTRSIIKFENVSLRYRSEKHDALERVSFDISAGQFICLIGPSGGGKSSIVKLIAGLVAPTTGRIERPQKVAMVFQNGALLPWRTVRENIALGLEAAHASDASIQKTVGEEIARLGLEAVADKRPVELSGGQRQRVGIARALAIHPDVLLLDEPFSALDPKTTAELHADLLAIWKSTKATIVMVSHQIEEAVTLAERIFLISDRTVKKTFDIPLPYPRREQGALFIHEVLDIEKEFFRKE